MLIRYTACYKFNRKCLMHLFYLISGSTKTLGERKKLSFIFLTFFLHRYQHSICSETTSQSVQVEGYFSDQTSASPGHVKPSFSLTLLIILLASQLFFQCCVISGIFLSHSRIMWCSSFPVLGSLFLTSCIISLDSLSHKQNLTCCHG